MVVDELEDHAFAAAGEDVFGRVELPARVRRGIDEPAVRGPGFFRGSTFATPASRKMRANDAVDGTGSIPSDRIFSWTLIGP